jgi:hypothetical protein
MQMNQKEQLATVLKTCDRDALRLMWAMQKNGLVVANQRNTFLRIR